MKVCGRLNMRNCSVHNRFLCKQSCFSTAPLSKWSFIIYRLSQQSHFSNLLVQLTLFACCISRLVSFVSNMSEKDYEYYASTREKIDHMLVKCETTIYWLVLLITCARIVLIARPEESRPIV